MRDRCTPYLLLLLIVQAFAGAGVQADETPPAPTPVRMIWAREPLDIELPLGSERQVTFPAGVKVGMPVELTALVRTQTLNGIVYWQASKAFPRTRVQVYEEGSGTLYLIDLSARDGAPSSRIEVLNGSPAALGLPAALPPLPGGLPVPPPVRTGTGAMAIGAAAAVPAPAAPLPEVDYVMLMRFAAQSTYGPSRLIEPLPGMSRTAVPKRAFPYLVGGGWNLIAMPITGWQHAGGLYVTVLALENRGSEPVSLDPRRIRGAWLAAGFQHATLLPAGSERHEDRTALYLISRRPFADAVQGRE